LSLAAVGAGAVISAQHINEIRLKIRRSSSPANPEATPRPTACSARHHLIDYDPPATGLAHSR